MGNNVIFLISAYVVSIVVLLVVQFFLTYLVLKKMNTAVEDSEHTPDNGEGTE